MGKSKDRIELSPEEIMVYGLVEAGMPISQIAETAQKDRATIHRWLKKTRDFIAASDFNIEDYRMSIHGLFPLWLRSVVENLRQYDTTMTVAIGKGMQYFVEKSQSDVSRVGDMSDTELDTYIKQEYGKSNEPVGSEPDQSHPGNC